MKKRNYPFCPTSVDLSLAANDIRLWLQIYRHPSWNLRTVIETGIIELGRRAGYPGEGWKQDPGNKPKIERWLEHNTKYRVFFEGEQSHSDEEEHTVTQTDVHTEEEERMEVYA